jgi:hypothetical protein
MDFNVSVLAPALACWSAIFLYSAKPGSQTKQVPLPWTPSEVTQNWPKSTRFLEPG